MKKVKNLRVAAALQAILLSGATLSAFVSCVDDDMEVADNPAIVSEIVDLDNSSKVEEVTTVQTDYVGEFSEEVEDEYIDSDEVIVTDVNENESSEEKVTMTVSTISNSEDKGTVKNEEGAKKSNKSTSKSGDVAGKSGDITTKVTDKKHGVTTKTTAKETNPVTKKTTVKITTAKPVTTKTITTEAKTELKTEPITEPPVVTDAPRSDYNINEICYDANAFNYFADKLCVDLKTTGDGSYYDFVNGSPLFNESKYLLALLNEGYINEDVLMTVFADFSSYDMDRSNSFFGDYLFHQSTMSNKVKFGLYSCDDCQYGQYIDQINDAYLNNYFDQFASDQLVDGNIEQRYLDSTAIRVYFDLCDYHDLYTEDTDFFFETFPYMDKLESIVNGRSYSLN